MEKINSELDSKVKTDKGSYFGWIILIISSFVLLNDFVFIPNRRREYLTGCVIWESMIINAKVADSGTRQIFYDCNGEKTTPEQVKYCWEYTIPETANFSSGVISKCLSAPDYPKKILFD